VPQVSPTEVEIVERNAVGSIYANLIDDGLPSEPCGRTVWQHQDRAAECAGILLIIENQAAPVTSHANYP
jgi:hypothetical protein